MSNRSEIERLKEVVANLYPPLDQEDIERMEHYSKQIILFGRYINQSFESLPSDYIQWLDKQTWLSDFNSLCQYVRYRLRYEYNNQGEKDG